MRKQGREEGHGGQRKGQELNNRICSHKPRFGDNNTDVHVACTTKSDMSLGIRETLAALVVRRAKQGWPCHIRRHLLRIRRSRQAGAESLAGVLGQCASLAHLNLSYNEIGDGGAESFAGVLTQCTALTQCVYVCLSVCIYVCMYIIYGEVN